jgi:uncharacterized membrane protein YebE (DUF533 family)
LDFLALAREAQRAGVNLMADWRKIAMAALLADGVIDESELKVIKKELYANGKIDQKELEFLIDLRFAAQKKARGTPLSAQFEHLFFKAVQDNVLADGNISAKETSFLRKAIRASGKMDDAEKAFLKKLKKGAKKTSPAFEKLYAECVEA